MRISVRRKNRGIEYPNTVFVLFSYVFVLHSYVYEYTVYLVHTPYNTLLFLAHLFLPVKTPKWIFIFMLYVFGKHWLHYTYYTYYSTNTYYSNNYSRFN
jgi:hypothetical protein